MRFDPAKLSDDELQAKIDEWRCLIVRLTQAVIKAGRDLEETRDGCRLTCVEFMLLVDEQRRREPKR